MNTIDEIRRLEKENKKLMTTIEWYNEKVTKQEEEKTTLLSALLLCLPIMEAHTEASHLTDGFRPRVNKNDRILKRIKDAISKADIPAEGRGKVAT